MSPGILGKKIGMSQVFRPDGQAVPVTLLKAGPCMVTQRKTPTTDGYDAVQLGLVEYAKERTRVHVVNFNHLYDVLKHNDIDENWLGEIERRHNLFPDVDYRVYA